jgi:hypothetical protein
MIKRIGQEEFEIKCKIDPKIMWYKNNYYEIKVKSEFVINEYFITLKDGHLDCVKFKPTHPNKDPKTNEYCISTDFKEDLFDVDSINDLEDQIMIYNFMNYYDKPWHGIIEYKPANMNELYKRAIEDVRSFRTERSKCKMIEM